MASPSQKTLTRNPHTLWKRFFYENLDSMVQPHDQHKDREQVLSAGGREPKTELHFLPPPSTSSDRKNSFEKKQNATFFSPSKTCQGSQNVVDLYDKSQESWHGSECTILPSSCEGTHCISKGNTRTGSGFSNEQQRKANDFPYVAYENGRLKSSQDKCQCQTTAENALAASSTNPLMACTENIISKRHSNHTLASGAADTSIIIPTAYSYECGELIVLDRERESGEENLGSFIVDLEGGGDSSGRKYEVNKHHKKRKRYGRDKHERRRVLVHQPMNERDHYLECQTEFLDKLKITREKEKRSGKRCEDKILTSQKKIAEKSDRIRLDNHDKLNCNVDTHSTGQDQIVEETYMDNTITELRRGSLCKTTHDSLTYSESEIDTFQGHLNSSVNDESEKEIQFIVGRHSADNDESLDDPLFHERRVLFESFVTGGNDVMPNDIHPLPGRFAPDGIEESSDVWTSSGIRCKGVSSTLMETPVRVINMCDDEQLARGEESLHNSELHRTPREMEMNAIVPCLTDEYGLSRDDAISLKSNLEKETPKGPDYGLNKEDRKNYCEQDDFSDCEQAGESGSINKICQMVSLISDVSTSGVYTFQDDCMEGEHEIGKFDDYVDTYFSSLGLSGDISSIRFQEWKHSTHDNGQTVGMSWEGEYVSNLENLQRVNDCLKKEEMKNTIPSLIDKLATDGLDIYEALSGCETLEEHDGIDSLLETWIEDTTCADQGTLELELSTAFTQHTSLTDVSIVDQSESGFIDYSTLHDTTITQPQPQPTKDAGTTSHELVGFGSIEEPYDLAKSKTVPSTSWIYNIFDDDEDDETIRLDIDDMVSFGEDLLANMESPDCFITQNYVTESRPAVGEQECRIDPLSRSVQMIRSDDNTRTDLLHNEPQRPDSLEVINKMETNSTSFFSTVKALFGWTDKEANHEAKNQVSDAKKESQKDGNTDGVIPVKKFNEVAKTKTEVDRKIENDVNKAVVISAKNTTAAKTKVDRKIENIEKVIEQVEASELEDITPLNRAINDERRSDDETVSEVSATKMVFDTNITRNDPTLSGYFENRHTQNDQKVEYVPPRRTPCLKTEHTSFRTEPRTLNTCFESRCAQNDKKLQTMKPKQISSGPYQPPVPSLSSIHQDSVVSPTRVCDDSLEKEIVDSLENEIDHIPKPVECTLKKHDPKTLSCEDLNISSIECLLEQLIQRGKVESAFVMDLEGSIIARSLKAAAVTEMDARAFVDGLRGSYRGLMRLEVGGKAYICFKAIDDSVLVGRCQDYVTVSKKGDNAIVVGFSPADTSGSCIVEMTELSQVISGRGL